MPDRVLNILQTNKAYYPVLGGVETVLQLLAEGLHRRDDVSVRVLVCDPTSRLGSRDAVVNGVRVTYARTQGVVSSMPVSLAYAWRLARAKADIIHVHEPFPLADISLMASVIFKRTPPRIVLSWHNDIVRQKRVRAIYTPLLRRFLDRVDRVVVATPHHITSSHILPEYAEKCSVIPYGMDLSWAAHPESLAPRAAQVRAMYGSPLVLFVGRLVYYKGVEYLVRAMAEIPDARLLIVGAGPLEGDIAREIAGLKLTGRVTVIPPVAVEELHALYAACDLFVLPSAHPTEGFGIVQVEAMACGKPVVSTDLPTGVTYVNRHGDTGLIVPPADHRALAGAIRTLLGDSALRDAMGTRAREWAVREFSQEAMIDRTVRLYRQILETQGAGTV